ncbi:hypothetical protein VSR01_27080 [Actinacidiphila sp. DG2A-62]|uniref:hypothetical protein n=1 Tax=Actinacidiphila sp. DG2A-62 TaxID=3108821 RepID=UPI002DBD666D|nr:hypothetical protein [Actinacidiphila sp. DG2A-62]MEC3996973.1 hypothetical protein [Actinacidiphila sp. DG2A-62]
MRHEETEFVGGPLDGRVLEVIVGMTGQPPRSYTVPVPGDDGRPDVTYVYHRQPSPSRRTRWVFVYDPEGKRPPGPRWPWSKRS